MPMGNPSPLGLLGFALTTLTVMYVEMEWTETAAEQLVCGYAATLGGFAQILAGILELFKGSTFSYTVFCVYGAYWVAWAIVYIQRASLTSSFSAETYESGKVANYLTFGVLTLCFWTMALRKNGCLIFTFSVLVVAFFLLAAAAETGNTSVKKTAGAFGFLAGLGAFYTAIAELVNEEWGRHVLPGLQPIFNPERHNLAKDGISKLLSYDSKSNTLMLNFRGLQVRTQADVQAVYDGLVRKITEVDAPSNRVHVVVDYKGMVIADSLVNSYFAMASELQRNYYLSLKRFNVASFGERLHPEGHTALGMTSATLGPAAATATTSPPLQNLDTNISDRDL